MLLALAFPLLMSTFQVQPEALQRDEYGVPHIRAASADEAWFLAGYATAQDRLWQMEMSRRVALGRLSEVFGPKFVEADTEALRLAYTPAELRQQYLNLRPISRRALDRYASGVNTWIEEAKQASKLPPGYAQAKFEPRAWEVVDSVAIAVSLFQRFGSGASGQMRNLAALQYLKAQPALKQSYLEAFDDLAWTNDSAAPTTVLAEDDSRSGAKYFPAVTREQTERQLAQLPDLSLLELLPALRALEKPATTEVAEILGAPYKVGSYAMVVSPSRSASGKALLLSGPQMGFSNPSVVHEMAVSAPGLQITGMDVPGVPGILVGCTPFFAWGLTSGVADTDDVFVHNRVGPTKYRSDASTRELQNIPMDLPVAGEQAKHLAQLRTTAGPVILSTKKHLFSRRSSYRMREMKAFEALFNIYSAAGPDQIERAIRPAPMSFNFCYATVQGDTGYLYIGDVPRRARGLDPRLPTPAGAANDWGRIIPKTAMPHVRNPKSGLLTNWNNKPAEWWPNQDTPVWGEIDHVREIRAALERSKLTPEDLRLATERIATRDESWPFFAPYLKSVAELVGFDGSTTSAQWPLYRAILNALRHRLFSPKVGDFTTEDLFRAATQPTLLLRALQGKTRIPFLNGRERDALIREAASDAAKAALTPRKDEIPVPGAEPINFRNRGTFIQIVELASEPLIETILPPGESESGQHQIDQADLARHFKLKRTHLNRLR